MEETYYEWEINNSKTIEFYRTTADDTRIISREIILTSVFAVSDLEKIDKISEAIMEVLERELKDTGKTGTNK